MNGSTAKKINRSATKTRVSSRLVKRKYYGLNQFQKREARRDMVGFCIDIKKARSKAIRKLRESEKAASDQALKAVSKKRHKRDATASQSDTPATQQLKKDKKPPFFRRLFSWFMLKLGFWNWETSYRFERNLKPKG